MILLKDMHHNLLHMTHMTQMDRNIYPHIVHNRLDSYPLFHQIHAHRLHFHTSNLVDMLNVFHPNRKYHLQHTM